MTTYRYGGSLLPESMFQEPLEKVRGNRAAEAERDKAFARDGDRIRLLAEDQPRVQAPHRVMGATLPRIEPKPLRVRRDLDELEGERRDPAPQEKPMSRIRRELPATETRLTALRKALVGGGATTIELAALFAWYEGNSNSSGRKLLGNDLKALGATSPSRGALWTLPNGAPAATPAKEHAHGAVAPGSPKWPDVMEKNGLWPPVESLPVEYLEKCVGELVRRARVVDTLRKSLGGA